MDPSFTSVLGIVRDITVTGMLVFILYGGARRWWVWGYQLVDAVTMYERLLKEERERTRYWQEYSSVQLNTTEQVVRRLPVRPSPQEQGK